MTLSAPKEKIGRKLIEDKLGPIVYKAWSEGFSVSSNFARQYAGHVGMAASMQLITTRITKNVYGSVWQITAKGIRVLNELEWVDTIEDENGQ